MSELDPNVVVDSPSGSDQQAQKRVRTSRPKVKTGCSVCKQRRIKCDEKRPSCTQCVRGRKTCSGYPPPSRHTLPIEGIRIAPKPAAPPPTLAAAPPASSPIPGLGATRQDVVLPPRHVNRLQRQEPLVPLASSSSSHPNSLVYHTPTASSTAASNAAAPPPLRPYAHHQSSPSTYEPHPPGLSFSLDESLYFSIFRTETLSGLAGLFDSSSWRQRVLQDCHANTAIQHAAIALGALFKTLEQGSRTPSPVVGVDPAVDPNAVRSHWRAAVQHYSLACNSIAVSSSPGEGLAGGGGGGGGSSSAGLPHHHRTRLLVSTLLGTFDAFIGDHRQAIVQIQNGLSLLERLPSPSSSPSLEPQQQQGGGGSSSSSSSSGTQDSVESDLAVVFTRLAISAKSYDLAFHFPDPYIIRFCSPSGGSGRSSGMSAGTVVGDDAHHHHSRKRKTPFSNPVPPGHRFNTIREARLAHEGTLDRGVRFLERLQEAQSHARRFFPRDWEPYGAAFVGELSVWAEAFGPLFASRLGESPAFSLTPRDRTAIATLQMEHINAHVLFLSLFSPTEVAFDAFLPQFAAIIELAREVVAADEAAALATHFPYCAQPPPSSITIPGEHPPETGGFGCPHHRWDDPPSVLQGGFAAYHLRPSFTADLGIVPPLFMVATKCREPTLRRQAIALLRCSARREGMWDSELVARIGDWVMQLEEAPRPRTTSSSPSSSAHPSSLHHHHQHLGPQPQMVPESQRVMIHAVDFDLRSRIADLSAGSRNLQPGEKNDPLCKTTRISW